MRSRGLEQSLGSLSGALARAVAACLVLACLAVCIPTAAAEAAACSKTATFWAGPPSASARCNTLVITNACADPLWIQNTGVGAAHLSPQNQKLGKGESVAFNVPKEGLASTRFWAKWGCDASGGNCKIGSSDGGCNETLGCAPPVDTKFEATFGCVFTDTSLCVVNPSDPNNAVLASQDNIDMSMVDGYTLPATGALADGRKCAQDGKPVAFAPDLSGVYLNGCPAHEAILGFNAQDLQVQSSPFTPTFIAGCFAPCTVLTHNNWGQGNTLATDSGVAKPFCCTAKQSCDSSAGNFGPFGSGTCPASCFGQGQISASSYYKTAGAMAPGVYRFAYDDGNSLAQCEALESAVTTAPQYEVTFSCPRWNKTDPLNHVVYATAETAAGYKTCDHRCNSGGLCPDGTACDIPSAQVYFPALNTPANCVLGTPGCTQVGCCDDHQ